MPDNEPLSWRIATVRGAILELGGGVGHLRQAGLDCATAQLLLARKRAELDSLMQLARPCPNTGKNPKAGPIKSP